MNGTNGVTVTINIPPKYGNYTGNSSAVEAIVAQPQTLIMSALFGVSQYNLSVRAVALQGSGSGGGYCVLALDPNGYSLWGGEPAGFGLWGGAQLTMAGCGLAVNASGSYAVSLSSGGTLTAPSVSVVGGLWNNWDTVNVTSLKQNQSAVADPYANVSMPTSSGCDYTWYSTGWTSTPQTIYPGRYCYGLQIQNGGSVVLSPGIYYIKSGQFGLAGGATIKGTGVTIVLTTADGANSYANISITNGTSITLSAPTSGTTAGILFFGDRNSPTSTWDYFSGFTTMNLTGAIYVPTHVVDYGGGGTITGCSQLIAYDTEDSINNLAFNGTCTGTGMLTIGASATLLVE